MLSYRVILLLLCGAIGTLCTDDKKLEDIIDQVATASENVASSFKESKESITEIIPSTELPELDETTQIHYENSNGFVPMISSKKFLPSESLIDLKNNTLTDKIHLSSNNSNSLDKESPFFSDARLLLNLPQEFVADKRSYDSQENQKGFELLKVNKQIPAIANYHEFYENMQNNLNSQASNVKTAISDVNKNSANNLRTKNRIKQIEDYLSYDSDLNRESTNAYSQFYSHTNSKPTQSMFEPEKVYNNYPQSAASSYDIFGESVTRQRAAATLPHKKYHESTIDDKKNLQTKNRQQYSKPLVVIEPANYKVDVKYNNQQYIGQVSTMSSAYENQKGQNDESEDRYDRNEDGSNESSDYLEITERPKKIHKSRRRPYNFDSSRKLPKEHRGQLSSDTNDDNDLKKTSSLSKTKSQRTRAKPSHWTDDDQDNQAKGNDASNDEEKNLDSQSTVNNNGNAWNQVGQNIEFSQSNGYQVNQVDKQNVLVPVNLVPLANFDHSTAIGSSQGFDVTNAGVPNFITAGPIVSTASPLISTGPPIIHSQNSGKNYQYSTSVPEIIVGQNAFQNPVQAVFLNNKYPQQQNNVKTQQYYPSTVAPVFAVSSSTLAPKPSNPTSQVHHLLVSQPTLQTILQSPTNPNNNYNILVNTRGLNGQNQQSTAQNNNIVTASRGSDNSAKKNTFTSANNQFLASASLSVDNNNNNNNLQSPTNSVPIPASSNINPVYATNQNNQQYPAIIQQQQQQQSTNIQPAYLAQLPKQWSTNAGNAIFENTWSQLQQLQSQDDQNKNFRFPFQSLSGNTDSLGSTSNNNLNAYNTIQGINKGTERAQLPVVGMQTVQIQNPNINPFNQYQTTAVLTTPIPIFSTTGNLINSRPLVTTPESINIQGYVDSLTQIGAAANNPVATWQNYAGDRPAYNPMNFVPSNDLLNSQSVLNSKSHVPEPLPQHLNLVPLVPGGNFYKHSASAQVDLITKPKLSSDLEKYAEEMLRESLRTIHNTHKWNSDKKIRNLTAADLAELKRLKDELDRFKLNMLGTKNIKDVIEGHHSETNLRTVEPGTGGKRPGLTVSAIEELFKTDYGSTAPGTEVIKINDYLTPPKANSFVAKSPFLDKPAKKKPNKKGVRKENNKLRPHSRPHGHTGRHPGGGGLEAAASNYAGYSHRRPHHERKEKKIFNEYPTFTTSTPETLFYLPDDYKYSKKDEYDFSNKKLHNLFGLLMKNKQLPRGTSAPIFKDDYDVERYLDGEKNQGQINFYEDAMNNFQKKSDSSLKVKHL